VRRVRSRGADVIVTATDNVTGVVIELVVAAAAQAAALEAAVPSAASVGSSAAGEAPTDLAEPERRTRLRTSSCRAIDEVGAEADATFNLVQDWTST